MANESEQTLFFKCLWMVNGNMKNFSASLGSREEQTGTAVHCNSTAVRDVLANVKKKNDECWRGSR